MNIAPVLIDGKKAKVESCLDKKTMDVYDYTKEELFLLTLTFSGKINRENLFEIYEDIIEELELNLTLLEEKREELVPNLENN